MKTVEDDGLHFVSTGSVLERIHKQGSSGKELLKMKEKDRKKKTKNNYQKHRLLVEGISNPLVYEHKETELQMGKNYSEGNVALKRIERKTKIHCESEINELNTKMLNVSLPTVESYEEGRVKQKNTEAKKKKKKKQRHYSLENNALDKKVLEESVDLMGDIRNLEVASQILENHAEEATDLPVVENHKEGSEMEKIKRKEKRHNFLISDLDKKALEEPMQELFIIENAEGALQTAGNNEEVNEERSRKKMRYDDFPENKDLDSALEEAKKELLVKVTPETYLQVTENAKKKKTKKKKKKKKKKRHNFLENSDMDQKASEEVLQELLENVAQEERCYKEVNAEKMRLSRKEKTTKDVKSSDPDQNMKEAEGSLELPLPVETNLNAAFRTVENHEVAMKKQKVVWGKKKPNPLNERDNSLENIGEEATVTLFQVVQKSSMGEVSVNCSENILASKGSKTRIKMMVVETTIRDEDDASTNDPSPKQLPQKNGDECYVISEENMEMSLTNYEKDEILYSSSPGDVIKVVLHGGDKDYKPLQRVPTSPETPPISCNRRKLLVLDLNGLLADIGSSVPREYKVDKKIGRKPVFKRPFCDDFLKFCFERFNVGVWSSRAKKNVIGMIDFLMGSMKHNLLFCWDQSHCTQTGFKTIEDRHKPLVLKELRKLWDKTVHGLPWEKGEYNEWNTLLLDDSPYKALRNPPHTAVFPFSYSFQDKNDNALGPEGDIRVYLEGLAMAEDVQKYVELHQFGQHAITDTSPSWAFYSRVISS